MPLYKQKAILKKVDDVENIQSVHFEDLENGTELEDSDEQVQPAVFDNFDEIEPEADISSKTTSHEEDAGERPTDRIEPIDAPSIDEVIKNVVARAEKEAEAIRQKAREEGLKEGFERGYKEGLEKAKEKFKEIEKVLEELRDLPKRVLGDYREWLINAAFTIAKTIVQTELSVHPQLFLDMLQKLIAQLDEATLVTVYLNPDDLADLRIAADLEDWTSLQDRKITLKADPELSRGNCRVESEVELIDFNLETCLEELKRDILAKIRV